jgi:hypothetical protein
MSQGKVDAGAKARDAIRGVSVAGFYAWKKKAEGGKRSPRKKGAKNRARLRLETHTIASAPTADEAKLMLFVGTVTQFRALVGGM